MPPEGNAHFAPMKYWSTAKVRAEYEDLIRLGETYQESHLFDDPEILDVLARMEALLTTREPEVIR
jgi:hypothetical protein